MNPSAVTPFSGLAAKRDVEVLRLPIREACQPPVSSNYDVRNWVVSSAARARATLSSHRRRC